MIELTLDTPTRKLIIELRDIAKSAILETYVEDGVFTYTAMADDEVVCDWRDITDDN